MQATTLLKIESVCHKSVQVQQYGTQLFNIGTLYKIIVFGRLKAETRKDSGKIPRSSFQKLRIFLMISLQATNQSVKVNQYWTSSNTHKYRKWKEANKIIREEGYELTQHSLSFELKKRQIPIAEGTDILRWGYEERGTFITREAYKIIIKERIIKDTLWDKIWNSSNWPKVSTFLWLLCHNRILTWDNLKKRSFSGPSICLNFKQEEETTTHLMQTCQIGRKLWENVAFRCQKDGRVQGDIKETIRN